MADKYVYHGGNDSDGSSWANAYQSINSLISNAPTHLTTSGNRVLFASDHVCPATNSADLSITGPSSGAPVLFLSLDRSDDSYLKSSTAQIDTTEGVYDIVLNGSFACYGIKFVSGGYTQANNDNNEVGLFYDCTFFPGDAQYGIYVGTLGFSSFVGCTFDFSADSGSTAIACVNSVSALAEFRSCSFVNGSNRTGNFLQGSNTNITVGGCDISGLSSGSITLAQSTASGVVYDIHHTKLPSTYNLPQASSHARSTPFSMSDSANSGNNPTVLVFQQGDLGVYSTTAIYRTSGQEIEGVPVAWNVVTQSNLALGGFLGCPWIYGYIDTTDSTNFDVFITNDTADFDNDEVWLEVQYKATSSSGTWTRVDDAIATIVSTPAAQDDDTSSTWNGTGPSFTYKQRLRVTATVNQIGQFRARVCVGKPSISAGAYFYIDPLVVVS